MVSKTLAICFPFFENFLKYEILSPKFVFSHYLEIHNK